MNYFFRYIIAIVAFFVISATTVEHANAQQPQQQQSVSLPKLSVSVDDTNDKNDVVLTLPVISIGLPSGSLMTNK